MKHLLYISTAILMNIPFVLILFQTGVTFYQMITAAVLAAIGLEILLFYILRAIRKFRTSERRIT